MSKPITLTPPRNGHQNGHQMTNGSSNRVATSDNVRLSVLTDFAGKTLSGPQIGKKFSIDPSLVYTWSKNPEIYKPLGFSEKSFSHRRMTRRVKKSSGSKSQAPSLEQQLGPVKHCPNCGCNVQAVAIAMRMSS